MPAISTLEVCANVPGENMFTDSNAGFVAIDPPSWFNMEIYAIDFITGDATYKYTVQPNEFIGAHTIYISESDQYIVVTITDCPPDYSVTGCIGDILDSDFLEVSGGFNAWEPYTELPEGVTLEGEGVPGEQFLHVIMIAPTVYNIVLVSYEGEGDGIEYIVIRITPTDCWEEIDPCEQAGGEAYPLNIAWLNTLGGWQSFIFLGKKTEGRSIGDVRIMKTSANVLKKTSIEDVYKTIISPSGFISEEMVDYVTELKYSIQVYLWNSVTEAWDIPIIVDSNDFELKKQGSGFYKYDFSFRYANEIIVQNG